MKQTKESLEYQVYKRMSKYSFTPITKSEEVIIGTAVRVTKSILDERVALLRQLTTDLYHRFPKGIIWRENCDTVCDMCEEYVHKKIEEVFGKDEDKNG